MCSHERWVFLALCSLTFFANKIIIDQTGVLIGRLSGAAEACKDGRDSTCLLFTVAEFNGLFVAHYWAGGCGAVLTGLLVGKFGIWVMSWVSALLMFIGMTCFTIGPYFSNDAAFGLMLSGRFIFGYAYFSHVVISHQVKSHWFLGKELGLSFTIYFVAGIVGSVLALAAVGPLLEVLDLQKTLWVMFTLGMIAPISAVAAGWVYKRSAFGETSLHLTYDAEATTIFDYAKLARLGRDYWVLCAILCVYCTILYTFLADFPSYLIEEYHYSEAAAGQITGAIPDIAILSVVFGLLSDRYGYRDIMTFFATGILFLALIFQATIPGFDPVVTCVLVALTYALSTASMWSSIPIVEKPEVTGVALGVAKGLQGFGVGLMLLGTGFLLNQTIIEPEAILEPDPQLSSTWKSFFVIQAVFGGAAFLLSMLSIHFDKEHGSRLRKKFELDMPDLLQNEGTDEFRPILKRTISTPIYGTA